MCICVDYAAYMRRNPQMVPCYGESGGAQQQVQSAPPQSIASEILLAEAVKAKVFGGVTYDVGRKR